jgi:hypothetical protein
MLRKFTLLVALAAVGGSCGPDGSDADEREAGVYAAVIEALIADDVGEDDVGEETKAVVYAGALDEGATITLEVQSQVVEQLEDVATVRFVDERTEAIDSDADEEPVLEQGVLVLLGSVPGGRSPTVRAERYVDVDDIARYRMQAQRSNGAWTAVAMD